MKNINLTKKNKICVICILVCILLCSLGLFISNQIQESRLKNPDKVMNEILKIFYEDKYNSKMAKIILNKDANKYFEDIEKDLYTRVYNSVKYMGDEKILEDKDVVTIAKEYSNKNIALLKQIDKYSIDSSIDSNNEKIYTIKVYPKDLSEMYAKKNECIIHETKAYPEENYKQIINYYCTTKSLNGTFEDTKEPEILNITLKKNKKGYYIPTEESLNSLLEIIS